MLLLVQKDIIGEICYAIYWYVKADNKYTENYDKHKEYLYLKHWYVNNLYGLAISQKLPINEFKWVRETS